MKNINRLMSNTEANYIKGQCRALNWDEIENNFPIFWSFVERLPESHNNGERVTEACFPEIYEDLCARALKHLDAKLAIWKSIITKNNKDDL